jgi:hypothetical protein
MEKHYATGVQHQCGSFFGWYLQNTIVIPICMVIKEHLLLHLACNTQYYSPFIEQHINNNMVLYLKFEREDMLKSIHMPKKFSCD